MHVANRTSFPSRLAPNFSRILRLVELVSSSFLLHRLVACQSQPPGPRFYPGSFYFRRPDRLLVYNLGSRPCKFLKLRLCPCRRTDARQEIDVKPVGMHTRVISGHSPGYRDTPTHGSLTCNTILTLKVLHLTPKSPFTSAAQPAMRKVPLSRLGELFSYLQRRETWAAYTSLRTRRQTRPRDG